jgi:endonuclease/exonuclease/phosphatase family metal-dependent hydrolase
MYRPVTSNPTLSGAESYSEFIELFSNLCDTLTNYKNVVLLGDLNIDILSYGSNTRSTEFVDLLFSFGMLQIVTKPTRCNEKSATLIDHIITNVHLPSYRVSIITSLISDHFPVIFNIRTNTKGSNCPKTIQFR